MPNYRDSKLYAIRSHRTLDVYYGSTTGTLKRRLQKHKANYTSWLIGKSNYCTSYEIIKHDDAYIELVELFPCNIVEELTKREGEIIRASNDAVNKNRYPEGRSPNQYYKDNPDKYNNYRIKYSDKIIKFRKSIKKCICECGSSYNSSHKNRHENTLKHKLYLKQKDFTIRMMQNNNIKIDDKFIQSLLQ